VNDIQAVVNNVVQVPNDAYNVSGSTITFTSAPSAGTGNVYVRYMSTTTQSITPSQNTVGIAQLSATGTPSSSTYLRGDNTWASISSSQWTTSGSNIFYNTGNVGIGTATPTGRLDVSSSSAGVTAGDLVVDTANKTVYVGRQSSTGGDNSYLVVRGRVNGTGTNQAISITGDTSAYGTGIFRPNNDNIGFSTAGTERARITETGNFAFNSGYGSVAIAYGCRAWVNFNGTGTVAIRGSGNVSSISDINTGLYRVNFSTAMPDTNYGNVFGFCMDNASSGVGYYYGVHTVNGVVQDKSTTALQTLCKSQTGNDADSRDLSVSIYR
jgi:hypothetical protein